MKTEYYIHNNIYCKCPLCKVINDVFYRYDEVFEQWEEVPYYTRQCKNGFPATRWLGNIFIKVTEEEAFRHLLEN